MQDIQTNRSTYQRQQSAQNYFKEAEYRPTPDNGGRKFVVLGFLISIIVIGIIGFLATYIFDGANILIKPLTKDLPINETFVINPVERESLINIKSVTVNEVLALPKNSVKKVSKKAEGTIMIYNNNGTASQKLIKGTRFTSSAGKIFRIQESVTVPGKNGNTAGSVSARVVADAEGEEYNVGPTRFSIPGFKGSPKFNTFYAESSKAMTGGSSGKSSEVSDLDMEKGKVTLKENIDKALLKKLESDVPDGFVFNKDMTVTDYSSMDLIDSDNTTATYSINATGTSIYLKKELLIQKIVEKTESIDNKNASVEIREAKDFIISVLDPTEINDPNKPIRVIVTGTANVVFNPSKEKIVEFLTGKEKSSLEDMTKNIQFVESASSVVRPFWASKFPNNPAKINVEFK